MYTLNSTEAALFASGAPTAEEKEAPPKTVTIEATGSYSTSYRFGAEVDFPYDRLHTFAVSGAENDALSTLAAYCKLIDGRLSYHELDEAEVEDHDRCEDVEFEASARIFGRCEVKEEMGLVDRLLLKVFGGRTREEAQKELSPFTSLPDVFDVKYRQYDRDYFFLLRQQIARFRPYPTNYSKRSTTRFIEGYFERPSLGYSHTMNFLDCGKRLPRGTADAAVYFSYMLDEGETLPLVSRMRLDEIVRLYDAGKINRIILSGVRRNERCVIPAAEYLRGFGIPMDAIIVEDKAENTWENIEFSLKLIEENGIESVVFVSSPYHMDRILRYYEQQTRDNPPKLDIYWSTYPYSAEETDLRSNIVHEVHSIARDHFEHGNALRSSAQPVR